MLSNSLPRSGRRKRCGSATSAPGSRTLSRFGVADEQIYLTIRDHLETAARAAAVGKATKKREFVLL